MANRHNARSRSDYSRRPYPRQPPPRFYGKLAAAAPFEEAPLMLLIRRTKAFGDLLAYFRHFLLVFLATLHPKAFSKYHYRSPKSTLLRTLLLLLRFSQPYDVYVFLFFYSPFVLCCCRVYLPLPFPLSFSSFS